MSDWNVDRPKGVLRRGWSAVVGDYAMAGGWILRGETLVVGDAAGGVLRVRRQVRRDHLGAARSP